MGETGCECEVLGEEVNQQTLTLQSSPHQLLPSLLDRMCSDCHTTTCTTTGPVLRTVTCCTVRETVISPHPALQPVSHWLCGVLPLSASSEAHTLLPSLRHSVLQALRTILPDPSLHSVSCGDIEDSVAGETTTLVTFQSHSHRLSPTDPQRGGGGGVRGRGGGGGGRRCGEREWTGADSSHLHSTSGHTGTAITCSTTHQPTLESRQTICRTVSRSRRFGTHHLSPLQPLPPSLQVKGEGDGDGERGVKREGVVENKGSVEGERVSVCY